MSAKNNIDTTKPHFVLHIIEAKDVRAADSNGKSDPYVEVKINGHKAFKTHVIKETLNPKWDSELWVGHTKTGKSDPITEEALHASEFIVHVLDKDKFGKSDFLGEVKITGEEVIQGFDKNFPLRDKEGAKKHEAKGEIHLKCEYHRGN